MVILRRFLYHLQALFCSDTTQTTTLGNNMKIKKILQALILSSAAAALTACGGGSDSGKTQNTGSTDKPETPIEPTEPETPVVSEALKKAHNDTSVKLFFLLSYAAIGEHKTDNQKAAAFYNNLHVKLGLITNEQAKLNNAHLEADKKTLNSALSGIYVKLHRLDENDPESLTEESLAALNAEIDAALEQFSENSIKSAAAYSKVEDSPLPEIKISKMIEMDNFYTLFVGNTHLGELQDDAWVYTGEYQFLNRILGVQVCHAPEQV